MATYEEWLRWNSGGGGSGTDLEAARRATIRSEIGFWLFVLSITLFFCMEILLELDTKAQIHAFILNSRVGHDLAPSDIPPDLVGALLINSALWYLASAAATVAFFLCVGAGRSASKALGLGDFRWSWGWTVGSYFIPLVNLVRPWFGFAEIHGSLVTSAKLGLQQAQWRKASFARGTWLLVIMVAFSLAFTVIVNSAIIPALLSDGAPSEADVAAAIESRTDWIVAFLFIEMILIVVAVRYLWSMVRAAKELLAR